MTVINQGSRQVNISNPAMEFEALVFEHNLIGNLSKFKLDLQTLNVFMSFNGNRSIGTICREDKYDIKVLAEKIQFLLGLELIRPINYDGGALNRKFFQHITGVVGQPVAAVDCAGFPDSNKTFKSPGHPLQPQGMTQAAETRAPEAIVVFETMMLRIFSRLQEIDAEMVSNIRIELSKHVAALQSRHGNTAELILWLNGRVQSNTVELPFKLMREVITHTYALACEYYGPDIADRMLQSAARSCSTIPEARKVSPSQFL